MLVASLPESGKQRSGVSVRFSVCLSVQSLICRKAQLYTAVVRPTLCSVCVSAVRSDSCHRVFYLKSLSSFHYRLLRQIIKVRFTRRALATVPPKRDLLSEKYSQHAGGLIGSLLTRGRHMAFSSNFTNHVRLVVILLQV